MPSRRSWRVLPTYFNSIKVRLEQTAGEGFKGSGSPFQFHKGTIRTEARKSEKMFRDYISIP